MNDDSTVPREPDSFTSDLPDATEDTIATGLRAVSERRQARQAARDEYWAGDTEFSKEHRTVQALNRAAALRGPVNIEGVDYWWAVCVCRWCSLRYRDAEQALREYDKHPCSIPVEDDAPMRAQRDLNVTKLVERPDGSFGIAKRPASTLIPAVAALRAQADEQALAGAVEGRDTTPAVKQIEDETAERFALLELK